MQESKGTVGEKVLVPKRPGKKKKIWEYFEQNKEAILADYHLLKLSDFFKRWGIATKTWILLKKKWGVRGKGKGAGSKLAKSPSFR